ncbi:hypothetical protein V2O64_19435 [Verrucomicrobiaceae bacterium 227]
MRRIELPDPRDEQIASLEAQLDELKAEADRERDQFRNQAKANTVVMGQLKDLLVDLKEKVEAAPKVVEPVAEDDTKDMELEKRRRVLEAFRLARLLAAGEEHDLIVTERGEPFFEVVINEVTDIGISIRHRGGAGRIDFEDLPKSWRDRFGYDPERASKALERERVVQAKYAQTASQELLAQKEKNEILDRELREARLALAVAEANRPAAPAITVVDQDPNLIPVQPTIVHEHYDSGYSSRPTLHVPVLGSNGSSNHRPSVNLGQQRPTVVRPTQRPTPQKPSVQRPVPVHNEAVTRPPITRPPASASTQRPSVQRPSPSPTVQRPSPSPSPAVQRPQISRPTGRQTR